MSGTHIGIDRRAQHDERVRSQTGDGVAEPSALGRRFLVERILCPIDFSETSRAAVRYAVALAKWYGAEIRALHAVDVALTAGSAELSWDYIRAARAEASVELRNRLRESSSRPRPLVFRPESTFKRDSRSDKTWTTQRPRGPT
jgi:hypothetical protein